MTKLTSAVAGVTLQGLLCFSLCPPTRRSLHSVGVWLERLLVSSFADRYAALGADRLTKLTSAVAGVTLQGLLCVSLCPPSPVSIFAQCWCVVRTSIGQFVCGPVCCSWCRPLDQADVRSGRSDTVSSSLCVSLCPSTCRSLHSVGV